MLTSTMAGKGVRSLKKIELALAPASLTDVSVAGTFKTCWQVSTTPDMSVVAPSCLEAVMLWDPWLGKNANSTVSKLRGLQVVSESSSYAAEFFAKEDLA